MKKHLAVLLLACGALAAVIAPVEPILPLEEIAVGRALDAYASARARGDEAALRRLLHPNARVMGTFPAGEGDPVRRWLASSPGGCRRARVLALDRAGDAAAAKVAVSGGGGRAVDFLSLLRVDGDWRIVGVVTDEASRMPDSGAAD